MKKTLRTVALALFAAILFTLPAAAQKTDYQIGEAEGGLLNDGKVKEAFEKALEKFEEWMPSGHVMQEDGYYLQTFEDKNKEKSAVYVGKDYGSYILRGPIYAQLESLGGLKTVGLPVSDAYQVNGVWYQNFEHGYATVGEDNGQAVFTKGIHVSEDGGPFPITDVTDSSGSDGSSGSDRNTDTTDSQGGMMSSASEMMDDAMDAVSGFASKWAIWIFVGLAGAAVAVPLVYWLVKKR